MESVVDLTFGKDMFVLVGAGASADHSKSVELCPPLGGDLGERLREYLPEFREVEKKVKTPCGKDFEEWMEIINKTDPANYTDVLWCLSKYFSKFNEIPEDSLYTKLINTLGWENLSRVIFVSLNYETLLELAIRKAGFRAHTGTNLDNFRDQSLINKQPEIPIIKPHGSCHYRIQMSNIQINEGVEFERFAVSDHTSRIELGETIAQDPVTVEREMAKINNTLPSVISAYNPEKSSNFNSSFILGVREILINRIVNCKKIAIIGMNFRESDDYINKIVRIGLAAGARLGFVGEAEAFINYQGLCLIKGISHQYLGNRFRENFENLIDFLRS